MRFDIRTGTFVAFTFLALVVAAQALVFWIPVWKKTTVFRYHPVKGWQSVKQAGEWKPRRPLRVPNFSTRLRHRYPPFHLNPFRNFNPHHNTHKLRSPSKLKPVNPCPTCHLAAAAWKKRKTLKKSPVINQPPFSSIHHEFPKYGPFPDPNVIFPKMSPIFTKIVDDHVPNIRNTLKSNKKFPKFRNSYYYKRLRHRRRQALRAKKAALASNHDRYPKRDPYVKIVKFQKTSPYPAQSHFPHKSTFPKNNFHKVRTFPKNYFPSYYHSPKHTTYSSPPESVVPVPESQPLQEFSQTPEPHPFQGFGDVPKSNAFRDISYFPKPRPYNRPTKLNRLRHSPKSNYFSAFIRHHHRPHTFQDFNDSPKTNHVEGFSQSPKPHPFQGFNEAPKSNHFQDISHHPEPHPFQGFHELPKLNQFQDLSHSPKPHPFQGFDQPSSYNPPKSNPYQSYNPSPKPNLNSYTRYNPPKFNSFPSSYHSPKHNSFSSNPSFYSHYFKPSSTPSKLSTPVSHYSFTSNPSKSVSFSSFTSHSSKPFTPSPPDLTLSDSPKSLPFPSPGNFPDINPYTNLDVKQPSLNSYEYPSTETSTKPHLNPFSSLENLPPHFSSQYDSSANDFNKDYNFSQVKQLPKITRHRQPHHHHHHSHQYKLSAPLASIAQRTQVGPHPPKEFTNFVGKQMSFSGFADGKRGHGWGGWDW